MTSHDNVTTLEVPTAEAPPKDLYRRDRRANGNCDIWSIVAPGVPCPACTDTFADRLLRAV